MPVRVDAHQHFWRLSAGDYGWITPDMTPIARDFGPADLAPLLAAAGVSATVLVQAAPTERDTEAMLAEADRTPWVAGVVGWVDLLDEAAAGRIAAFARHPRFRGIRPMLQDQADLAWLESAAARRGLDALRGAGLSFDALIRPHQIDAIAALADRHPRLPIVIDHAAKPAVGGPLTAWADALGRAAARPNVHCKLSGLLTEARPGAGAAELAPVVDALFARFGPERLLWGSDWPVLRLASDYAAWHDLSARMVAERTDAAGAAAVMGGTAARFYRLPV